MSRSRSKRALASTIRSRRSNSAMSCSHNSFAESLGSEPGGAWRAPAASSSLIVMIGTEVGAAAEAPRTQSAVPWFAVAAKST
eukprot:401650-Pleurochrysis_carterae.AAC.1